MNLFNSGYVFFGIIAVLAIIIFISIIKKAIKLVIFIIVIRDFQTDIDLIFSSLKRMAFIVPSNYFSCCCYC